MSKYQYERSRCFMLILYPDEDKTHASALNLCRTSLDYACILHDKDLKEDADHIFDFKKSHYHVVLYFKHARTHSSVAKLLNIADNYISVWDNRDKALEYLIHFNDVDKYQYSIDEVHGSLKKYLVESISNSKYTDVEAFCIIRDYIVSFRGFIKYVDVVNFSLSKGIFRQFKKYHSIFRDLIIEKNHSIIN